MGWAGDNCRYSRAGWLRRAVRFDQPKVLSHGNQTCNCAGLRPDAYPTDRGDLPNADQKSKLAIDESNH